MLKHFLHIFVLLLLLGLLLVGCTVPESKQVELGKRIYEQQCAACHGTQGQGQFPEAPYKRDEQGLLAAPPHNANGHTWHHADGLLVSIIKDGLLVSGFRPMPAFANQLSAEDIRAVLAYIKTWWTPDQVGWQATASAQYTPPSPTKTPST